MSGLLGVTGAGARSARRCIADFTDDSIIDEIFSRANVFAVTRSSSTRDFSYAAIAATRFTSA